MENLIFLIITIIILSGMTFLVMYTLSYGMMPWEFITEPLSDWNFKRKEKKKQ